MRSGIRGILGLVIWLSTLNPAIGQNEAERIPKRQFGIGHDNDFFVLTDRYYSSGLFVFYRFMPKKGLLLDEGEQWDFDLGMQAFTPSNITSFDFMDLNRPYAGLSRLISSWSYGKETWLTQVSLLTGITGPSSNSGGFQRWYHRAVAISDAPVWVAELADSFHLNLYLKYVYEWQLITGRFGVWTAVIPELAIGSMDVFAEPRLALYFGKRSPASKSVAYNRLGSTDRELFFSVRWGYRWVGYNGLIQGNGFGDRSLFTTSSQRDLFRLGIELRHRFGPHDYVLGYAFNGPETEGSTDHQYLVLRYSRSF